MYRAPVDEILFALKIVAGLGKDLDEGRFGDLSEDLVDAVIGEAGRFASDEIAPLNRRGDEQHARWHEGKVSMPEGWPDLYRRWREGGWNSLSGPEQFGGQDLPIMLSVAANEMWNSASMAFGLGPLLTTGAVEALYRHATHELQAIYLEKLVSGEWMGTMNLTEPQAGSDLAALRSRAERNPDGSYRLFGQKIFITYGEHDFTENIVHLVLARLPDAPAGTRGISLFLVPKFLPGEDGRPGARNDVICTSIEDKIGIHGSPTCTMIFGDGSVAGQTAGATGYLIGEENRGLACMFTMMNNARLNVGIQGVAIAEAAYQQAFAYAQERRQGRATGGNGTDMSPIIEHPDILRTLLVMKSLTTAARSICYACAHAIDRSRIAGASDASHWQDRANLLTPIAKSFSTDIGVEVASLGVQVHGGMGFIEETGAGIYYRDARIAPIYEGTNGIQAIDLVMRKLPLAGGEQVASYQAELREILDQLRASNRPGFGRAAEQHETSLQDLAEATIWVQAEQAAGRTDNILAGATAYLRLFGLVSGGAYLVRAGLSNQGEQHMQLARFYAENLLGETSALKQSVTGGADSILQGRAALG